MQDSREKKRCLIFARNNANDTADRIEAYAKKSGMEVVETIFNTDKKAVERLRYYIERDAIICVLVRDVVDISMELNEIKAVMTLAAEHGISINAESRGYEPALISLLYRKFLKSSEIVYNRLEIKNDITKERRGLRHDVVYEVFCFGLG